MTRVKICSISDVSHAFAAAEAGADYVGFNFVPGVRRQLPEDKARAMVQAYRQVWGQRGPKLVGVFADQPVEEVNRILQACGLDMAQLSGNESPRSCTEVQRPVIKAVHVPDASGQPADQVASRLDGVLGEYERVGALALLDPDVAGAHGGTGAGFDWAIAKALAARHRFLLAGGLTPENVAQAVASVHPWGVDVSSGVEAGGLKDPAKIKAFVAKAKSAGEKGSPILRLLFVCGGNTCRSPMAAAIARRVLDDTVQISSAGVDVREQQATQDGVDVLKDLYGIDLSGHVPSDAGGHSLTDCDLVIAMTSGIADQLLERYQVPVDKLVVWSVTDPYRRGRAAYEQCARQLSTLIERLAVQWALPRR